MTEVALLEGQRPTVLVVDDEPDNLFLVSALLRPYYRVKAANGGERGLLVARSDSPPDLILLDVMMPGLDGYEICRQLKADPATQDIPVIFLTALVQVADAEKGFAYGAVDYVTKPVSPPLLLARVRTHIQLKAARDTLQGENFRLNRLATQRTRELVSSQDAAILAMASLAETRDNETGNHIRRTQHYVRLLAEHLSTQHRWSVTLTDSVIELLFKSAPLHDIGKVGVPDAVLLKPGRLTPEEFEVMKRHTTLGFDAIRKAEALMGLDIDFLRVAKEIVLSHHEKWNGCGYPQGLKGDAIPMSARLMAVADVYDALVCKRVYKKPFTQEAATQLIVDGRDTHFDPDVVDAFLAVKPAFEKIANQFADETAENPSTHHLEKGASV